MWESTDDLSAGGVLGLVSAVALVSAVKRLILNNNAPAPSRVIKGY